MCRVLSRVGGLAVSLVAAGVFAMPSQVVLAQDLPTYETTRVAEGVYRIGWEEGVTMFVVGDDGVAAFDPLNPEAAADYASEIKRVAGDRPLKWIIYSHSDLSHATGADVLSDAFGGGVPIVATAAAVDDIATNDDPAQVPPTVTFERFMRLELGGRTIELHFFGPSHTDNLLVGYVPDARVAYAADFVTNDRVGYQSLRAYQFPEQNVAIRCMMGLDFEHVIHGHGDDGDRASMWRQALYFDALESAVRGAIAEGLTEDQAAERIRLSDFKSFEFFEDWRELNVRGAYRILTEGM